MNQSDRDQSAPRRRRQLLLPQITRLAREGFSSREIGEKLALPKATVGRWLRATRRKPATNKPPDPAELIVQKIARHKRMHRRLIDAWRDSRAEKQVRLVEDTSINGDNAATRKKKSVRTETRTGDANYLARAMETQNKIDDLEDRLAALRQTRLERRNGRATPLADLTDDELQSLTADDLEDMSDDQLFAVATRLRAIAERNGVKFSRPLLAKDELRAMTGDQLAALELQLLEEFGHRQNSK